MHYSQKSTLTTEFTKHPFCDFLEGNWPVSNSLDASKFQPTRTWGPSIDHLWTEQWIQSRCCGGFTTITNLLNFFAFTARGLSPSSWLFLSMMARPSDAPTLVCAHMISCYLIVISFYILLEVPMLPGVNGASATALKAVAQDIAANQAERRWTKPIRIGVGLLDF